MNRYRVKVADNRPRIVQAKNRLDAIVKVCNSLGLRYADVSTICEPVNPPSINGLYSGLRKRG